MQNAIYTPSAWGAKYHALRTHEALGAGSAGPGKTLVLLMDALEQIHLEHERCLMPKDHPHYHGFGQSTGWALHLRRTRTMLDQTIARAHRMFGAIDPGVKWDSQRSTFTFQSGYRYQFGHCKDPDDWEGYMSAEFQWIGFDELVQFLEEQYEQIKTRLRSSDPLLARMMKVRSMSNPVVKRLSGEQFTVQDPQWVRRYFVDPAPAGNKVLKKKLPAREGSPAAWRTRIYLPARLSDNPDKDFVAQYEETLRDAKPHIRAALLDGNWYATAGCFYSDLWNPDLHTCEPFRIPSEWPCFRSMDWGFKKPGCVHWGAQDPDGNIYVFREYTFQGRTAPEVAKRIREIEEDEHLWKGRRSKITGPADTQLWEKRGDSGLSKAEEMASLGVSWVPADKRSRERNAERIQQRLQDHNHGSTTPGLVIFRSCTQLIRTLPSITTDPNNPECPMDGGDDHWHDSLGYMCAYASRFNPRAAKVRDEEDDDDKPALTQEWGQWGYGA